MVVFVVVIAQMDERLAVASVVLEGLGVFFQQGSGRAGTCISFGVGFRFL